MEINLNGMTDFLEADLTLFRNFPRRFQLLKIIITTLSWIPTKTTNSVRLIVFHWYALITKTLNGNRFNKRSLKVNIFLQNLIPFREFQDIKRTFCHYYLFNCKRTNFELTIRTIVSLWWTMNEIYYSHYHLQLSNLLSFKFRSDWNKLICIRNDRKRSASIAWNIYVKWCAYLESIN